jgi:hypothetical protein
MAFAITLRSIPSMQAHSVAGLQASMMVGFLRVRFIGEFIAQKVRRINRGLMCARTRHRTAE